MEVKRYVLTLSCADVTAIVASVAGFLAEHGGFITESGQFGDASTGQFFMRTEFTLDGPVSDFVEGFKQVATDFAMDWQIHPVADPCKTIIMVSKQGHCLNDLLHRVGSGNLPIAIEAVISNHADLEEMASWYKIPFYHLPVDPHTKAAQEQHVLELVKKHDAELVVLARYMQILSEDLCHQLAGCAINIHHSFLPSFKGAKPYHQAYDRGVKIIGATAHFVTSDLDEGPIIEQEVINVTHKHSAEQLVSMGQDIESRVLSRAVRLYAERRLLQNGHKTVVFK